MLLRERVKVHHGDCLVVLDTMVENSIDAVVTDPPYELGFMGRSWDASGVAFCPQTWAKVLRVMKPGAHLAAFGAPKNYHRLACAIEDAGFEIRDSLMWIFGSGFPKSLDVSKAIDKAAGAEREVIGVAGKSGSSRSCMAGDFAGGEYLETAPATDSARKWSGWGTALKPAYEPIVLARKPLSEKTVAANVLRWGTGAINIDATRVETSDKLGGGMVSKGRPKASEGWDRPWMHDPEVTERKKGESANKVAHAESLGRWPANLCHDGSDEVLAGFPITKSGTGAVRKNKPGLFGLGGDGIANVEYGDEGSAARFFYCAKASKSDRAGSKHPTVKPVSLMRWLVRMVTPPNGVILDPFGGSGTTGQAAYEEGFEAVLIEREAEYVADIQRRMESVGLV